MKVEWNRIQKPRGDTSVVGSKRATWLGKCIEPDAFS